MAVATTTALLAGAALSAAGSAVAANQQKKAAKGAANAAKEAQQSGMSLLQPYAQGGTSAYNRLMWLMGIAPQAQTQQGWLSQGKPLTEAQNAQLAGLDKLGSLGSVFRDKLAGQQGYTYGNLPTTPTSYGTQAEFGSLNQPFAFQADPGYQFRMDEAMKALQRSAAAKGMLQSGGTLKGIQQYGQGLAAGEYQNAWQRWMNERQAQVGQLMGLAGMGQQAAGAAAGVGTQGAQNYGNYLTQFGNAQAGGIAGLSNILSGLGSQYYNSQQQQNMLNQLMGQGTGGSSLGASLGYTPSSGNFTSGTWRDWLNK